jgi:hypothetical protein
MGYKRPTLKLVFEDEEFEGLEVKARRLSINDVFRVAELADLGVNGLRDNKEQLAELLDLVAGVLTSWNLEDEDGVPVPRTGAGLGGQDLAFVTALAGALSNASASVPRPLEPSSNGGQPSPEVSLPMEPLSPSPGS